MGSGGRLGEVVRSNRPTIPRGDLRDLRLRGWLPGPPRGATMAEPSSETDADIAAGYRTNTAIPLR